MKWLFGKKDQPKATPKVTFNESYRQVKVEGSDFVSFNGSKSPNGKFLVACMDAIPGRGGARQSGHGTFVLAEDGNLRLEKKLLERPNESAVANNGNFIINDWLFSDDLAGTFYAFNKDGQQLIRHSFKANLYDNAISDDGTFAICSCAGAKHEDGTNFAFFDLSQAQCLWQKKLPTGPFVKSYHINTQNQIVTLTYSEETYYHYDFTGKLLDQERWDVERVKRGQTHALIKECQQQKAIETSAQASAAQWVDYFQNILKQTPEASTLDRARLMRFIAENHEILEQFAVALEWFERAQDENSKVGVKTKIKQIQKKLTQTNL